MIFSPGPRSWMVLLLAFAAVLSPAWAANARRPAAPTDSGQYKSAIVMDAADGRVLHQENADLVTPPASMTKLMTFAVLCDRLEAGAISLATEVRITPLDASMGGTGVYLDPRETFTVEELIYAMMIQSANDAAHALARASAGSREAFVELMNAKATELGMTKTRFYSPHGLPARRIEDGDLTTARDFAVLSRHLLLKTNVLKYTSVTRRDFGAERSQGPMKMVNHNKLLQKVSGVDGLKTGYTKSAGYCISATAERNGRRVIVVVMGSFGRGGRIDEGESRNIKTIELIEKGFAAIPPGTSNFAAARSKFIGPAVIPLDAPPAPVTPATPAPADSTVPKLTLPVGRK